MSSISVPLDPSPHVPLTTHHLNPQAVVTHNSSCSTRGFSLLRIKYISTIPPNNSKYLKTYPTFPNKIPFKSSNNPSPHMQFPLHSPMGQSGVVAGSTSHPTARRAAGNGCWTWSALYGWHSGPSLMGWHQLQQGHCLGQMGLTPDQGGARGTSRSLPGRISGKGDSAMVESSVAGSASVSGDWSERIPPPGPRIAFSSCSKRVSRQRHFWVHLPMSQTGVSSGRELQPMMLRIMLYVGLAGKCVLRHRGRGSHQSQQGQDSGQVMMAKGGSRSLASTTSRVSLMGGVDARTAAAARNCTRKSGATNIVYKGCRGRMRAVRRERGWSECQA